MCFVAFLTGALAGKMLCSKLMAFVCLPLLLPDRFSTIKRDTMASV